ncbi:N-formylglutamate amidohydrolase [Rhodobacteraceae bacterium S2214]|nr:N-formylglutamate amidohydrolase [Rhodobacteraceae bacterium S2214]
MCKNGTHADVTQQSTCVGGCDNCKTFKPKDAISTIIIAPHASQALGDPDLQAEYAALNGTHFAVDIGTAELAADLAADVGATLFTGTVGRLGIDLNRSPDQAFDADRPDGYQSVRDLVKQESLRGAYTGFHARIAEHLKNTAASASGVFLVDLHSFNRMWRGQRREVDVGVCDHQLDSSADFLLTQLQAEFAASHAVRMDEPYPGTHPGAFIARHYHAMGARTVTIEICNDLIATPEGRAKLLPGMSRAITRLKTEGLNHV